MEVPAEATQLHSHTLDTLCVELVGGRQIQVTADGQIFHFVDPGTRSIFNWYRNNRIRWAANVRKEDVEAIVDCLDTAPPNTPKSSMASAATGGRAVYIRRVRAYHFGGLHKHANGLAVDTFDQSFEAAVLVEGKNGSGKTSLLSAVCWALTGYIFRSQRAPENILEVEPFEVIDTTSGTSHNTTSITPIPSTTFLGSLAGKPVPLDTWVEVTFCDEKGADIGIVKRTLSRSQRGKAEVSCSDMTFLGLDPIALRIATVMPGLIPYLQLGQGSELGEAIGTLTGIQPLEDLASHATKVMAKLTTEFVRERKAEIAAIDEQYLQIRTDLSNLFNEYPDIKPATSVPIASSSKDIEAELDKIKVELESKQATAFADAKTILGESFDPSNADQRRDLRENIALAVASIETKNLAALPSAVRLANLRALKPGDVEQAGSLVSELLAEAEELAGIASNPALARRLQLYARVASWIAEGGSAPHSVDSCPVCASLLSGKVDGVTARPVAEHIQELLSSSKGFLEKSLDAWVADATRRLTAGLCKELQGEIHGDLPSHPRDLLRKMLVDELFSATAYEKTIAALKVAAIKLCDDGFLGLPSAIEPTQLGLPKEFGSRGAELLKKLNRVKRAIAFSAWRETNSVAVVATIKHIVGDRSTDAGDAQSKKPIEEWPLSTRLAALSQLVGNARPISEALGKIDALKKELGRRRVKEKRIDQYGRAAIAIEPLTKLRSLVEHQVKSLMDQLGSQTKYWRGKIYQAASFGGPSYADATVDAKGAIYMQAETEGARVPVQHVSNASDLLPSPLYRLQTVL